MKLVDEKPSIYIDINIKNNKEGPKFKVGDHVRIWKYKNTFVKGSVSNWSEEVFVIKKIENTLSWTQFINDLNEEDIVGMLYEKEL